MSSPSPVSQPAPSLRLTPRALLEAKRLHDLHVHPHGQCVAFVVTEADFDDSSYVSRLWLTETPPPEEEEPPDAPSEDDAPTEEPDPNAWTRQLTYSHEGERYPRWSPDGRYLAFLSARPDPSEREDDEDEDAPLKEQVWILPGDGGEARKVTSAKEGVLDYAWTPDGGALVYLAPEPRPRPIEATRKEERNRKKIDPTVEHEERLRRQFWRVDVEERKAKLLFVGDTGVEEFALSPDGTLLCYATNYTGDGNDYHIADLYIRSLEDGATYKLLSRPGGKYRLRWSPDGTQVAFLSWLHPELSYSRESLFVVALPKDAPPDSSRANGREVPGAAEARLVSELDYDFQEFEWSKKDGQLYALAAVGMETRLFRIDPLTGEATPLLGEEPAHRRDIALDTESVGFAWVEESLTALPELYWRDAEGVVSALTKLNAEVLEPYRLPRMEVVSWESADGLRIEGLLAYPLDYQDGERVPLVVQAHGGPKGRTIRYLRNYYLTPVWASEGYAVLIPNFRGSEGYGNAFAIANRRDLGGGDFQDIMTGVDYCIALGVADPERLGIMGGSYGGYLTNWAIGHTDRFRAAISQFGIFHLTTDYSNSELSRWDNDYLGAYYWEDPEIYRRLSPGSYVENIQTPTLILHGEDDSNTFISNSKELYQALRHRGVATQFVRYPREGHGLQEPNHRLDEIRRCLAWMDRFLKRKGESPERFRMGDKIPHAEGRLELCVTRAEVGTYLGRPASELASEALLEVGFTLHRRFADLAHTDPLTLRLEDIRLELDGQSEEARRPIGVPLDSPGGKILLEGDNLRVTLRPDAETGELAFGGAVVFPAPSRGDAALRLADFPPVALGWTSDPADAPQEASEE